MCRLLANLVVFTFAIVVLCGIPILGQWIAWNGPNWLLMKAPKSNDLQLGFGTLVALIVAEIFGIVVVAVLSAAVNSAESSRG